MPNPLSPLMPILQSAADVIAVFSGSAADAVNDSTVQDALEVIGAIAPLVDSFSRGVEVSPDDVRSALAGMDDALSAFDQEIARQEQGG